MIIYIAGLQGVPNDLKEAAELDGANGWQRFWNVTVPMIRPALTICIFWTLNSGFQVFDVIYTLTGGGPGDATQSVAINIYEEAFKGNTRFGYATAKSTVLFIIVTLVTLLQLTLMRAAPIMLATTAMHQLWPMRAAPISTSGSRIMLSGITATSSNQVPLP